MASYLGRRKFLATLGGAMAAWPLAARAQQAEKKYAVGILSAGGENTALSAAFSDALRELRWVEGRNAVFEYRLRRIGPNGLHRATARAGARVGATSSQRDPGARERSCRGGEASNCHGPYRKPRARRCGASPTPFE
jgi:hypothetical protein